MANKECPTCGGPLNEQGRCELCSDLDEVEGTDHLGGTIDEICDATEEGIGRHAYDGDVL